jgi:hypothetical protein
VLYSGKADFEVIGVHGVLPWRPRSKLPRQTLIVGQVCGYFGQVCGYFDAWIASTCSAAARAWQ